MTYLILLISWIIVGGLSSILTYWLLKRKGVLVPKSYNLHYFIVGVMGGYLTFFSMIYVVSEAYFDK